MAGHDNDSALATQVGGGHYKDMAIQPFEYIHANGIPFAEGCVIKYVSRWRNKAGIQDLKKARHFLDLLIEAEEAKVRANKIGAHEGLAREFPTTGFTLGAAGG